MIKRKKPIRYIQFISLNGAMVVTIRSNHPWVRLYRGGRWTEI